MNRIVLLVLCIALTAEVIDGEEAINGSKENPIEEGSDELTTVNSPSPILENDKSFVAETDAATTVSGIDATVSEESTMSPSSSRLATGEAEGDSNVTGNSMDASTVTGDTESSTIHSSEGMMGETAIDPELEKATDVAGEDGSAAEMMPEDTGSTATGNPTITANGESTTMSSSEGLMGETVIDPNLEKASVAAAEDGSATAPMSTTVSEDSKGKEDSVPATTNSTPQDVRTEDESTVGAKDGQSIIGSSRESENSSPMDATMIPEDSGSTATGNTMDATTITAKDEPTTISSSEGLMGETEIDPMLEKASDAAEEDGSAAAPMSTDMSADPTMKEDSEPATTNSTSQEVGPEGESKSSAQDGQPITGSITESSTESVNSDPMSATASEEPGDTGSKAIDIPMDATTITANDESATMDPSIETTNTDMEKSGVPTGTVNEEPTSTSPIVSTSSDIENADLIVAGSLMDLTERLADTATTMDSTGVVEGTDTTESPVEESPAAKTDAADSAEIAGGVESSTSAIMEGDTTPVVTNEEWAVALDNSLAAMGEMDSENVIPSTTIMADSITTTDDIDQKSVSNGDVMGSTTTMFSPDIEDSSWKPMSADFDQGVAEDDRKEVDYTIILMIEEGGSSTIIAVDDAMPPVMTSSDESMSDSELINNLDMITTSIGNDVTSTIDPTSDTVGTIDSTANIEIEKDSQATITLTEQETEGSTKIAPADITTTIELAQDGTSTGTPVGDISSAANIEMEKDSQATITPTKQETEGSTTTEPADITTTIELAQDGTPTGTPVGDISSAANITMEKDSQATITPTEQETEGSTTTAPADITTTIELAQDGTPTGTPVADISSAANIQMEKESQTATGELESTTTTEPAVNPTKTKPKDKNKYHRWTWLNWILGRRPPKKN